MLTLLNVLIASVVVFPSGPSYKTGSFCVWAPLRMSGLTVQSRRQNMQVIFLCLLCLFSDFCYSLSLPSESRLMCCVVLFRASNQSHRQSPGEGLYTGQFVTTILVNLGSHRWLYWTLFMHGWSTLQGPHWYAYWESIASIPRNKDQVLGLIFPLVLPAWDPWLDNDCLC